MTGPSAYRYRPAAVLEATGDDVSSFLQGQFSNDLKPFSPGKVTYGLWLDAKGKVEADSFVIEREGGKFLIMSPRCSAEALRARLERFIIADDVTLTDRTERWSSIVVWGEGAESAAVLLKVEVPAARAAYDGGAVIGFQSQRWGEGTIEWLFESSEEESGASPDGLVEGGFRLLTEAGAEQERILRGGVAVPDELGAADLPQEAGIEGLAVSFNKGCYIGQEVMARLRSMGRVRRGLVQVRGPGKPPPVPSELFTNGRKIGELRSVAPLDPNGFVGRAMLTLTNLSDELTLGAVDGIVIKIERDPS